jgi:hypothetical protein
MRNVVLSVAIVVTFIIGFSCDGGKKEEERRKTDSLFLGISLNMEKKDFYDHCWRMNKAGKVSQGPSNQNVEYHFIHRAVRDTIIMRFYPTFHDDKINEMPVLYSYYTWAPWNKQYWADTLLTEMLEVYKDYYGDDFKVLNHKTMGKIYYQMKGRRRINLFKKDDQFVQAVFTDMKVEKEIKEKQKAESEAQGERP